VSSRSSSESLRRRTGGNPRYWLLPQLPTPSFLASSDAPLPQDTCRDAPLPPFLDASRVGARQACLKGPAPRSGRALPAAPTAPRSRGHLPLRGCPKQPLGVRGDPSLLRPEVRLTPCPPHLGLALGPWLGEQGAPVTPLSQQVPLLPGGEAELLRRAALLRGGRAGHLHGSLGLQRALCLPAGGRRAPAAHPQQGQVPRPAVAHGERGAGARRGPREPPPIAEGSARDIAS